MTASLKDQKKALELEKFRLELREQQHALAMGPEPVAFRASMTPSSTSAAASSATSWPS